MGGDAGDVRRPLCLDGREVRVEADDVGGVRQSPARSGESVRSIVYRKVSAVTGSFDGGEKRKPGRMRNVYVRPSCETVGIAAAISGRSRLPVVPS